MTLNTPGKQDGGFQLEVNGLLVINRTDVFYRDAVTSSTNSPIPQPSNAEGLLSPLLGGLLDRIDVGSILSFRKDIQSNAPSLPLLPLPMVDAGLVGTDDAAAALLEDIVVQTSATTLRELSTHTATSYVPETSSTVTLTSYAFAESSNPLSQLQASPQTLRAPIGFSGLFFR